MGWTPQPLLLAVDDHFGYNLFFLNLHEKGKYMQSSIQPRLEWSWGYLSFQNRTRSLEERSRIVLYQVCTSLHQFPLMRYQDLRENWRYEGTKDLIIDPQHILHVPWSKFDSLSPVSPGKAQFISQIVKIAHKIQNCVYITFISSFHYFNSFWAILTYHIWSNIRDLLDKSFIRVVEERALFLEIKLRFGVTK